MKIAIVVDMWLTGFDVPSLATMYVYKPMSGHNLMQAIARVNRVFGDKEGGLVVDYVGIASALKQAMNDYTGRDKANYGDTDVAKAAHPKFLENSASAGICSMDLTIPDSRRVLILNVPDASAERLILSLAGIRKRNWNVSSGKR